MQLLEIMTSDQPQKESSIGSFYLPCTARVGNFGTPNVRSSSILYPFYISYPSSP